jgi:hypothetical protein
MPACPSCAAEVDAEAELCLACGEPLGANAAAAAPAAKVVRGAAPPSTARETMVGSVAARRRKVDEQDPIRCPGCGVPSRAHRCPGCGAVLRKDD